MVCMVYEYFVVSKLLDEVKRPDSKEATNNSVGQTYFETRSQQSFLIVVK